MSTLELRNLHKSYGSGLADTLKSINLSIESGGLPARRAADGRPLQRQSDAAARTVVQIDAAARAEIHGRVGRNVPGRHERKIPSALRTFDVVAKPDERSEPNDPASGKYVESPTLLEYFARSEQEQQKNAPGSDADPQVWPS